MGCLVAGVGSVDGEGEMDPRRGKIEGKSRVDKI